MRNEVGQPGTRPGNPLTTREEPRSCGLMGQRLSSNRKIRPKPLRQGSAGRAGHHQNHVMSNDSSPSLVLAGTVTGRQVLEGPSNLQLSEEKIVRYK